MRKDTSGSRAIVDLERASLLPLGLPQRPAGPLRNFSKKKLTDAFREKRLWYNSANY